MTDKLLIKFDNYKLYEDAEFEIPANSNVVIVQGDNDTGKTSLITAIAEAYQLERKTPEPLNVNADKGRIMIDVIDQNGEVITVVQELYRGKSSKFYAIKDGKKITELYKIRELIGKCTLYSIPELSSKLRSEKTRKEAMMELITPLMKPEMLSELQYLEAKNVQLFDERRDVKRLLDQYKNTLATLKVSDEDKVLLEKEEQYVNALTELQPFIDTKNQKLKAIEELKTAVYIEEQSIKAQQDAVESKKQTISSRLKHIDREIEEHEKRIIQLKLEKETLKQEIEQIGSADTYKLINLKNQLNRVIAEYNDMEPRFAAAEERNQKIKEQIDKINTIKSKIGGFEPIQKAVDEYQKKYDQLDTELSTNRERIKKILSESNLPDGLEVVDNVITIKGLPFNEFQVSESKLYLYLVDLLSRINTSRFINAGKYSDYNKERFKELTEIAKRHGKMVFLENVISGESKVQLSCIVNEDQPEIKGDSDELLNMSGILD